MTPLDATEQELRAQISVTHHLVTQAKSYIIQRLTDGETDPQRMVEGFPLSLGYGSLTIEIDDRKLEDPDQLRIAAGFHSCRFAFSQAIWALIGDGLVIPSGSTSVGSNLEQRYTRKRGPSSESGGWHLEERGLTMPSLVEISPSAKYSHEEPLIMPSVFLLESGIDGAHEDVQEALSDAIKCYRAGLFRPAVTMLAKAMEGAWIELGLALANAGFAPAGSDPGAFETSLKDSGPITRKMTRIRDLYPTPPLSDLRKKAGVARQNLADEWFWSDALAETRNAIHFGAAPTIAYTYVGVSIFLISASTHLKPMYLIKAAADA